MSKRNIIASIFVFLFVFLFAPSSNNVAHAEPEKSISGNWDLQCFMFGHNADSNGANGCTEHTVSIPSRTYNRITTDFDFSGHRHGGSAMRAYVCLYPEGEAANPSTQCKKWECSGTACGTEYGGHPTSYSHDPYPNKDSGNISRINITNPVLKYEADVRDAQMRNKGTWTAYYCDIGTHYDGSTCVSDSGPVACTNGANNPPACNQCSVPLVWNGSACVNPPPASCTNGANNPPQCNQCTAPLVWNGNACVNPTPTSCTNGANNPPACNQCTAPLVWNGSACVTPAAAPSGTLSVNTCRIAVGASLCNASVTWNTFNRIDGAITQVTRNNPANTLVYQDVSGTNIPHGVTHGVTTFYLYHNGVELKNASINVTCTEGSVWANGFCRSTVVTPTPSGTINATNCTIPVGGSTCNSLVSWTTANLTNNPSAVTKNKPNQNTLVSTATSSSGVSSVIGFGQTTFFLYHNNVELSRTPGNAGNATCENSSTWNVATGKCERSVVTNTPSGTITVKNCIIPLNNSTCSDIDVTWTTSNIPSGNTIQVRKNNPGDTLFYQAPSATNIDRAINFGQTTFSLRNNTSELSSATATATCAIGTAWNNSVCAPVVTACNFTINGVQGFNATTGAYTPEVYANGFLVVYGSFGTQAEVNAATITINGAAANVTYRSPTQINIQLGAFTGSANLSIRKNTTCAAIRTFNILPPNSVQKPNLVASNVTPLGANINTPTTFSSTISNVGPVTTGGSFSNLFQRTSSPLGSGVISDLNPITTMTARTAAGTSNATGVATQSMTFTTAGNYLVRACADKTNRDSVQGHVPPNGAVINESDENDNCSPSWASVTICPTNTSWNGIACVPLGTTPSATLAVVTCEIQPNQSKCNASVTWNVTNPTTGYFTQIRKNNPGNTLEYQNHSGTNIQRPVNFGTTTFSLYHSSTSVSVPSVSPLKQVTINVACTSGNNWNTTSHTCVPIPPLIACPTNGIVVLSPTFVYFDPNVAQTVTASASPSGFYGGTFASTNTTVATVSGSTVTAKSVGAAEIYGNNDWRHTNGATGCSLKGVTVNPNGGALFTVRKKPFFIEN
ncbi:MAG: hypothetical protein AAB510_01155 [Patescibacteria group bacterium]